MKRAILSFLLFSLPLICRASIDGAVLNEINFARTHPADYAQILEARMQAVPGANANCFHEAADFLRRQRPLDPLRRAPGLMASARQHVADQGPTGGYGHRGIDGSDPWSRMAKAGQLIGRAGENISYGYSDARTIVVTLIVDQGVANRGHRHNIFCPDFKVAGAAYGPHARYGAMCVIDFAGGFEENGGRVATAEPWRSAWE